MWTIKKKRRGCSGRSSEKDGEVKTVSRSGAQRRRGKDEKNRGGRRRKKKRKGREKQE